MSLSNFEYELSQGSIENPFYWLPCAILRALYPDSPSSTAEEIPGCEPWCWGSQLWKMRMCFGSEAALSTLLQFARLISSAEACKGRSGPSSALIGSLYARVCAICNNAQGSLACQIAGFTEGICHRCVWQVARQNRPFTLCVPCMFVNFT